MTGVFAAESLQIAAVPGTPGEPGILPPPLAAVPGSPGEPGVLCPPVAAALLVACAVVGLAAGACSFARRDA